MDLRPTFCLQVAGRCSRGTPLWAEVWPYKLGPSAHGHRHTPAAAVDRPHLDGCDGAVVEPGEARVCRALCGSAGNDWFGDDRPSCWTGARGADDPTSSELPHSPGAGPMHINLAVGSQGTLPARQPTARFCDARRVHRNQALPQCLHGTLALFRLGERCHQLEGGPQTAMVGGFARRIGRRDVVPLCWRRVCIDLPGQHHLAVRPDFRRYCWDCWGHQGCAAVAAQRGIPGHAHQHGLAEYRGCHVGALGKHHLRGFHLSAKHADIRAARLRMETPRHARG
mmetsp:Transcript_13422/g.37127  ORF Transcript_13422/g.37127 Transcript_13422/m.37127 type:complete len:282 (+) Transcript_13422:346-1191(+)